MELHKIFISYRRSDTQVIVGRLRERLSREFGRDSVFRDIEGIAPGEEFATRIRSTIQNSTVVLVVIGPNWFEARDTNGQRRIDHANDWVRTELRESLLAKKVVIPVLFEDATIPSQSELPSDIASISGINAARLHDDPYFETDTLKLCQELRKRIGRRRLPAIIVGILLSVVLMSAAVVAVNLFNRATPIDVSTRKRPEPVSYNDEWTTALSAKRRNEMALAGIQYLNSAGKYHASGNTSREICALHAVAGLPQNRIRSFPSDESIRGWRFNHDRTQLLVWSSRAIVPIDGDVGVIQLWNLESGKCTTVGTGITVGAYFTKNGRCCLTWDNRVRSSSIHVWDGNNLKERAEFSVKEKIRCVSIGEGERQILVSCSDGSTVLFEIPPEVMLPEWNSEKNPKQKIDLARQSWRPDQLRGSGSHNVPGDLCRAVINTDGSRLVVWGDDNTAGLWDVDNNKSICSWTHGGVVRGAAFAPNADHVLTWSDDGTARLWSGLSGEAVRNWKHDAPVIAAHFDPSQPRVLTITTNGNARLWNLSTDETSDDRRFDCQVLTATFERELNRVLTYGNDEVALWDVTSMHPSSLWSRKKLTDEVDGREFSAFTKGALAPDQNDQLYHPTFISFQLWNLSPEKPLDEWRLKNHIKGASLSMDKSKVMTWNDEGKVQSWLLTFSEPQQEWLNEKNVKSIAFHPDGSHALTWAGDNSIVLRDVTSTKALQHWTLPGTILGAGFDEDAPVALIADHGNEVQMWSLSPRQLLRKWRCDLSLKGASLSHDITRVVAWSDDGTTLCWDVWSDEVKHKWHQSGTVNSAAFNFDATLVITANEDGFVRLWDAMSAEILRSWEHDAAVRGAGFHLDDTRMITWTSNGSVRIWDVSMNTDIPIDQRVLEWKVQNAIDIGSDGKSRDLKFQEWSSLVQTLNLMRKGIRPALRLDPMRNQLAEEILALYGFESGALGVTRAGQRRPFPGRAKASIWLRN